MNLIAHSQHEYEIIVSTRGYNTAENRNWITAKAINAKCEYIFMIDDDMIYEPDTLERLLAHKKDIIGGLYYTKYEKQEPVYELLDDGLTTDLIGSVAGVSLFKVKAMGGGLILIKCDVFKKISQPWYGYKWNDNGSVKMSNDWYFCEKARHSGFDIWCDSTVKAGHIGQKEF